MKNKGPGMLLALGGLALAALGMSKNGPGPGPGPGPLTPGPGPGPGHFNPYPQGTREYDAHEKCYSYYESDYNQYKSCYYAALGVTEPGTPAPPGSGPSVPTTPLPGPGPGPSPAPGQGYFEGIAAGSALEYEYKRYVENIRSRFETGTVAPYALQCLASGASYIFYGAGLPEAGVVVGPGSVIPWSYIKKLPW